MIICGQNTPTDPTELLRTEGSSSQWSAVELLDMKASFGRKCWKTSRLGVFSSHIWKYDHLLKDRCENITWYIETAKKILQVKLLTIGPQNHEKKYGQQISNFLHIGIPVWFPLHTKIVRTLRGFLGYKVIHHNPNTLYTFTTSNLRWVQLRRNAHYVRVLGHIGPIWATFKNHYNIPWC